MAERVSDIKDRLRMAMDLSGKKSVDITRDLGVPSSAISQYLSGKSKNMPIDRLYDLAQYLDVNEIWLMGFDVNMSRNSSPAASPIQALSPDEEELLGNYQKLNGEGRAKVLEYTIDLTENSRYKKCDPVPEKKMA